MGRYGEGGKKEVKGWKRREKDWPDQCQTASYVPGVCVCNTLQKVLVPSRLVVDVRDKTHPSNSRNSRNRSSSSSSRIATPFKVFGSHISVLASRTVQRLAASVTVVFHNVICSCTCWVKIELPRGRFDDNVRKDGLRFTRREPCTS